MGVSVGSQPGSYSVPHESFVFKGTHGWLDARANILLLRLLTVLLKEQTHHASLYHRKRANANGSRKVQYILVQQPSRKEKIHNEQRRMTAKRLSKVIRLVFATSLLGLRRGGRARRTGTGCVVGGRSRGRSRSRSRSRNGLRPSKVLGQGLLRPRILFFRHTPVQELYQERSHSPSSENEDSARDLGRLTVDEGQELSKII